ncbi:hypothetical protein [Streptomyces kronopolitis]|uniref:hypothetical protein n=1 Tax=Streptomyces kronopolitis TaxID=1612435 RepID=UPI0020BE3AED|nr:hypothetical protein [Streptomyces kronopolitis]MCL6298625.1 hypothetical protein [Streptomyces kronopolitis]
MRRGLVHAVAWTLATGAAVTLSWFGVHTVLSGTAYDPPRALPLSGAQPEAGASPRVSSTHRPKPSRSPVEHPSPTGSAPSGPVSPSATGGSGTHPDASPQDSYPSSSDSRIKSYSTAGGRVVFDLGGRSAELVSATPASGWQMQVWKQDGWIRVDFAGSSHTSVFCTWNGHPPTVQISTTGG